MKKKLAAMDDDDSDDANRARAAAKQRTCLSCGGTFTSIWAGERICITCKRSTSWRSGSAHKRTG